MPNIKTYSACAQIVPCVPKRTAYHDLTGRFSHRSSCGNEYLLIVYDYDSNGILHCPLKNKTGAEIKRGWITIHERLGLARAGNQPEMHILDNEASADLNKGLKKYNLQYQLVPPHLHRRNAVERAIRTYKSHLLAFLVTCDPEFPVSEWDRLLFQVELTLNLLRSSRVNPNLLSAHAYLHGNFDFNKTPLAPPGTKVVVHLKPEQHASWAFHGEEGWYVGPSMEHYRCVKCFLPSSARERDIDTLQFFPKTGPFPNVSTEDYLKQAASDILSILQKSPSTLPYLAYRDATNNAIVHIATLLGRAAAPPVPPDVPTPPTNLPTVAPAHPLRVHIPTQPPRVQVNSPQQLGPNQPTTPESVPHPQLLSEKQKEAIHDTLPRRVQRPHTSVPTRLQRRTGFPPPTAHRGLSLKLLQAIETFRPHVNHIYNTNGKKETINTLLSGTNGATWTTSLSNEFGRLAQGFGTSIVGTDTIEFIQCKEVPSEKKVTHGNFICDYRPLKTEP
jgi:hypothetical protein